MQPFLIERQSDVAELCRTHRVRRLSIFGSAMGTDFNPETSDVDVVVEFQDMPIEEYAGNKQSLREGLANTFQRPVDLLTWKSLRNPYMRNEIETNHFDLYAA